jgi:hypothetical protein
MAFSGDFTPVLAKHSKNFSHAGTVGRELRGDAENGMNKPL